MLQLLVYLLLMILVRPLTRLQVYNVAAATIALLCSVLVYGNHALSFSVTTSNTSICSEDLISPYLLVAYKCHTEEFHETLVCSGNSKNINCPNNKYIAVYSALSGQASFSTNCSKAKMSNDTVCPVHCVVKKANELCLGRNRCRLNAVDVKFNKPCHLSTIGERSKHAFLQLTYTCVERQTIVAIEKLLKENGSLRIEDNCHGEEKNQKDDIQITDFADSAEVVTFSMGVRTDEQSSRPTNSSSSVSHFLQSISEWIWILQYIAGNAEKCILYFLCGFCVGVILILIMIILRLVCCPIDASVDKHKDPLVDPTNIVNWRSVASDCSIGEERNLSADDTEAEPNLSDQHIDRSWRSRSVSLPVIQQIENRRSLTASTDTPPLVADSNYTWTNSRDVRSSTFTDGTAPVSR